DTGGGSLYFHQRSFTPEGDKVILRTREGIVAVDLTSLGKAAPRPELILAQASPLAAAWRSREAYFFSRDENALQAVHLDTKAVRLVVKLPPQVRGGQFAINCDESLLVAIGEDPAGQVVPRTPPADGMGGTLERQWAAGTPKMIYTVNVKTGEFRVLHRENDWTNHLQCSPTDPQQILFCHEGPWHYNNRTWTIRADGGPPQALHQRTMNMEIWGHEFFGHDGKTVWFDLQTPRSTVFWLAGVNLETGHRVWYHLQREEWSVHYNVSPDGRLFAGDGGGPGSVAARGPDGEILDPPAQGQWIYLFRPKMVRGNSPRGQGPLIDIGFLQSERLADMSRHDYSKDRGVEPNLAFTPDGKWIIFSGNFHSPRVNGRAVTHAYAVEIARSSKPGAGSK
ncbi:MAG: oligogalacturonate lyase family protein, partial [Opitutaceae bacterium]